MYIYIYVYTCTGFRVRNSGFRVSGFRGLGCRIYGICGYRYMRMEGELTGKKYTYRPEHIQGYTYTKIEMSMSPTPP